MKNDPEKNLVDESQVSRRDCARGVAVTAAALSIPSALTQDALAQQAAAPKTEAPVPAAPTLSPAAQQEVEAKYDTLMRKYGARFSAEQKADLHRMLVNTQDGIEQVRAYPLTNANEPVPFRVLVPVKGVK